MPPLPTGLTRDPKSGVYIFRRRIPADLLASYGGKKKEHIQSLFTKDYRTAVERHRREETKLFAEWERRRNLRAEYFARNHLQISTVINELTAEQIDKICLHFEAASLSADELRREENHYTTEDIQEYQAGYPEATAVLKAAVATGDVVTLRPILEQFLDLYRYELNVSDGDFRRLALAFGRAAVRTNDKLLQRYDGQDVPTPQVPGEAGGHTLSKVIEDYLARYEKRGQEAMFKKVKAVLPLMLEVIGDKPIRTIRQTDIVTFFDIVQRLPPRWPDVCRQRKLGALEVAALGLSEISKKTFDYTYLAVVRPFLADCKTNWQDRGWPTTLTTEAIRYTGSREDEEGHQRSFELTELKRLFEGPELKKYAEMPDEAHKFWLPHLGLYTGARVNELCQLNPQVDIRQDANSKIWFLDITHKSEADPRITKEVKTPESARKVPIHTQLINMGFLKYVEQAKKRGDRLLFAMFPPSVGKASPKAAKWFREFLSELGLRDETPGARIVGMHAFRSTFLHQAMLRGVANAEAITGHTKDGSDVIEVKDGQVDGKSSRVVRKYKGEQPLAQKADILAKIQYDGLNFFVPVALTGRGKKIAKVGS